MSTTIILGVVIAVLLVIAALVALKSRLKSAGQGGPTDVYYLRKALFSPAERSFLGVLEPLLPADVRVFGKVRLEDVFGVRKGLAPGPRQAARNRINRRHVDFLLVRASDLTPLAGVELDDISHDEDDRKARDAFVDEAFASAGLPLVHVLAQKSYNPTEVMAQITAALQQKPHS